MQFLHVVVLLCACCPSAPGGRLRSFHIVTNPMNISEARNTCRSNYTDLVTIYTEKENDELKKLVQDKAWIGAHRSAQWSDGAEVTLNKLTGDCGAMHNCCAAMKADGYWESIRCDLFKHFMCYDKEQCSYKLLLLNKTWLEAQLYCTQDHADLVTIRSEDENTQVLNQGKESINPFCIGLTYFKLRWFDGGQSTLDKMLCGLENTHVFTCLTSSGDWSESKTNAKIPVLCYKSLIRVSDTTMSWENGLDFCGDAGLLRIESASDQMETERELRKRKISGPVWLGLRQSRLFGFWFWANGLNAEHYQNWKDGLQPEHQRSHHCGAMEEIDGSYKWTDKDCRSKFRVLCEMP